MEEKEIINTNVHYNCLDNVAGGAIIGIYLYRLGLLDLKI